MTIGSDHANSPCNTWYRAQTERSGAQGLRLDMFDTRPQRLITLRMSIAREGDRFPRLLDAELDRQIHYSIAVTPLARVERLRPIHVCLRLWSDHRSRRNPELPCIYPTSPT